jgi:diaminohydroxyphosphoribosylaminopyrimidine deaminase/5-amino-6-(5-phosphoribosylamino)uracil reductase
VIADDPKLTVRIQGETINRPPIRVVVDSHLRMPWDCHLITVSDAPTMVVTTKRTAQTESSKVEKLESAGVEVLTVGDQEGHCNLQETLTLLGSRGVQQVLIEAGPTLITESLKHNLVDEARIYTAPMILGDNGSAPISGPMNSLACQQNLKDVTTNTFGQDVRICGLL